MTFMETLDLSTAQGTIRTNEIHLEIRDYGEDTAVMKARPENSRLQVSDQGGLVVTCLFRLSRLEQFIRRIKQDQDDENAWLLAERCEGHDQTSTSPYSSSPTQPRSSPEKIAPQ
jgi:hypothetical protein